MLRTRVISAAIYLPLVIGAVALGGWWFFVFIGVALSLAAWEFVNLMRRGGHTVWLPATVVLVWIPLVDLVWPSRDLSTPGLTLVLLASLVWTLSRFHRGDANPTTGWALTLLAGLYIGWIGSYFVRLREIDNGLSWSLTAYGGTWLVDSGAYCVGRLWGRHKLAPRLSPGKTWEGILGGLVAGALSTAVLAALFGLGAWHGLVLGLLIATLSPIGDLGVSMIKRQVGAKDSGKLIPGHGGVFDRIDSLLISVAVAANYVIWIVE